MATEKQIVANQQNAEHCTGPRTEFGKRRARRNAVRHGLTAETVIDILEDPAAYKAFERAIKSDYSPQNCDRGSIGQSTCSLLWRLRRWARPKCLLMTQSGHRPHVNPERILRSQLLLMQRRWYDSAYERRY